MKKSFIFVVLILILSFVACLTACNTDDNDKYPVDGNDPIEDPVEDPYVPVYTGMTLGEAPRMLMPTTAALVDEDDDFDFQSDDEVYPYEDTIITIHFNNPKSYEILSFTFNNEKYSSYMFEPGSNMENIMVKVNVGDSVTGKVQYDIDAIKYVDGTEIKDVVIGGDQTLRLFIKYDITYYYAQNDDINPHSYTIESETITLADDSRDGYEFLGWYDDSEFTNKVTTIEKGSRGIKIFYAKWQIITYNIRYHLDGGDKGDNPETYTVESVRALADATKKDHIFAGWYKDPDFSEKVTELSGGDIDLYAKWVYGTDGLVFRRCNVGEKFEIVISGGVEYDQKYDDCYCVSGYYNTSDKVIIPNEWEGLPVTAIDINVFNSPEIKEITLPDSIKIIGEAAFSGCSGLSEITLPDGLQTIGKSAFSGCYGLSEITIPSSVQTIGGSAFGDCTGLDNITLNGGLQTIGEYAFNGCYGLIEITIPDSVQTIGEAAFSGCSGLIEITLPDGLQTIGEYAFSGCSGLSEITIPGSVQSIGGYAFQGCYYIDTVTINDGVKSIGNDVFSGCNLLHDLSIPGSVKTIEKDAFHDLALINVTLGEGIQTIGAQAFKGCLELTEITIPSSVQTIGEYAFSQCGLQTVTLNQGLKTIEKYAFYRCWGLTEIIIPSSVQTIGRQVFYECHNLSAVEFEDPNGWSCDGTIVTGLDDRATAANYLRDDYCNCIWERKDQEQ